MKLRIITFAALLFSTAAIAQSTYQPTPENLKAREQFQDEKFGVFLHWGLYSMMGAGEWIMNERNINYQEYAKLARAFYPSDFNADAWVSAIAASGAKYITITSRHHDGFSLFKSEATDYNAVDATPFGRDIIKEMSEACARHGIKLHLYYSHLDWHRTDYPLGRTGLGVGRPTDSISWPSYFNFMNRQLTELLTHYGPIGAIWFDGWWDHESDTTPFDWHLEEQYALIHRLQPSCLVADNHHRTPFAGEDIQLFERDLPGENKAGFSGQADVSRLPLETCQTVNDHWGYSITDNNYKSAKELIQMLVRAAGMGANLLLNIGPQPDGRLPELSIKRLEEIGAWMKSNSATIYGTRGGLIAPQPWGVSTQKGKTLYIHLLDLQGNELALPMQGHKVRHATLFGTDRKVTFQKTAEGIKLMLPVDRDSTDCIVQLDL